MKSTDDTKLERSPTYYSPAIRKRRHKILKTARLLIAANGIEKFNVRELCKEAGVALKTLYNTFYSKDRLIAVAIREAYDEIEERISYSQPVTTMEGIVERLVTVNKRNFKARNYTVAVTSLYFSSSTPTIVWETLQEMSLKNLSQWVHHTSKMGDFHEWVDADNLAHDIVNLEFTVINDWANERISDDQYLRRLVLSVLSLTAGTVTGPTKESIERLLAGIHESGDLPQYPKAVWTTKEKASQ